MKSIDKVAATPVFEDCKRGELEQGLKRFWAKRRGSSSGSRQKKTWKWITKFEQTNENNR